MTAVSPQPEGRRPKVIFGDVQGNSSTASSSSAGAPNTSGRITERHELTAGQRSYFINSWTYIGVEFT